MKERKRIQKKERKHALKLRKKNVAQKISDSTEVSSAIKNVTTTAMTSLTTASIGFGLNTLDMNAAAPSIGTGLAAMESMPKRTHRGRRRRKDMIEHPIGTINEETETEVIESTKFGEQMEH